MTKKEELKAAEEKVAELRAEAQSETEVKVDGIFKTIGNILLSIFVFIVVGFIVLAIALRDPEAIAAQKVERKATEAQEMKIKKAAAKKAESAPATCADMKQYVDMAKSSMMSSIKRNGQTHEVTLDSMDEYIILMAGAMKKGCIPMSHKAELVKLKTHIIKNTWKK